MPLFRVGFISAVHAVPPLAMPRAGQLCRLSDGRMGVLLSIEGATARVRVFELKLRNAIDVDEPLMDLRSFATFEAPAPDSTRNRVYQQQAEQYFANDSLGFPRMAGRAGQYEAVDLGKPWSSYNGFAHSVGKHGEVMPAATSLREQDSFYAKHGFCPVDGAPTPAMLEPQDGLTKVLVFTHPENPGKPRHVAVQGKDGLWDVKVGQGPHLKLRDPSWLCGGDAGTFARLYVKAPRS